MAGSKRSQKAKPTPPRPIAGEDASGGGERARFAEALTAVDHAIHSSLDLAEIADRALAEGATAIGAETGAIIGVENGGWRTWGSYNFEPSVNDAGRSADENPHGVLAPKTKHPVAVDDAYTDPRIDNDFTKRHGLRSVVVAPLIVRGEPIGALHYYYETAMHHFTEPEVDFVAKVASSLSLAFENARLFEAVRESEARFRVLFETMTEGFALNEIIVDDDGNPCDFRYLELNPAFERQTGLKAADIKGKTLLELFPESESVWIERYGQVALTGKPDHFQDQFGPLNRWFEVSVYQTQPGRFAVVFFDITEAKRAEAERERLLQELERRATELDTVFNALPYPVQVHGEDGAYQRVNPAVVSLFGFDPTTAPRDEIASRLHARFSDGTLLTPANMPSTRALNGEFVRDVEYVLTNDRGEDHVLVANAIPFVVDGQVHGAVLAQIDITQRKAAEEAALESNERLTDILNSMTDGFVSVDREWRYTLVNPRAEEMLKRPAAELLGRSMEDLYPDMFGWPEYRRVMADRKSETFEVWSKPLETWLEVHAYPTEEGISVLFTDVSERKRAEDRSQARLRMLTASGNRQVSTDDMIRLILDEIESLTGSVIGFYHFVEADQETLWLQNWSSNTLANMCAAEGKGDHYAVSEAGVWVDAIHERRPVIHNDYASLPHLKGLPEGHAPVIRELVVPILRNEQIVAIIGVGNKPVDYDETDSDTVSYLGDLSWEMVERRRVETALEESRERTDLLATMLDTASQPFAAATGDGELLDFNKAYEELTGYSADELHQLSWRTDLTPPEWRRVDADTIRRQMTDGGPVRYEKEYLRKDGTRVPVELVRNVQFDERGKIDYFYAFFTDITQRKQADRLSRALDDINKTIHSTLDFETIMSRVSAAAAGALACDSAEAILLEGDTWVVRYGHGMPDTDLGRRYAQDEAPVASRAASERRAVLVDVADAEDEGAAAAQRDEGIASILAVPMIVRDDVVGVLVFAYRSTPGSFAAADVDFAENLAASVSLGVENARLYERERTIADTLQEAVLSPPEPIESLDVEYLYRPASTAASVGGDFYDVFKADESHVVIVIGDISGKGVAAARMTSLVRDGIRAYSYESVEPGWILTHVNTLVHRSSPAEVFSTVFVGVLETQTGQLRYCGAGHPPAIIARAGDGEHLILEPRSTVVGAFGSVQFETEETHLGVGDILVLYTDGITEARRDRVMFGQERLLELLGSLKSVPLGRLPQAILDGVLDYTGGALSDDTVVLCIRPRAEEVADE